MSLAVPLADRWSFCSPCLKSGSGPSPTEWGQLVEVWLHRGSTGGYPGRNHDHGGGGNDGSVGYKRWGVQGRGGRKEGREAGCRTNRFILKRIDTIFQAKLGKRFLYRPNTVQVKN